MLATVGEQHDGRTVHPGEMDVGHERAEADSRRVDHVPKDARFGHGIRT